MVSLNEQHKTFSGITVWAFINIYQNHARISPECSYCSGFGEVLRFYVHKNTISALVHRWCHPNITGNSGVMTNPVLIKRKTQTRFDPSQVTFPTNLHISILIVIPVLFHVWLELRLKEPLSPWRSIGYSEIPETLGMKMNCYWYIFSLQ